MKYFYSFGFYTIFFIIILVVFLCLFIPVFSNYGIVKSYIPSIINSNFTIIDTSSLLWPTPGYTTITSGFGYRNAPTNGARHFSWRNRYWSTYTVQILFLVVHGQIVYAGFKGANGFTVSVQNGEYTYSYSHVSPFFLVSIGDYVYKGQIIAIVGPKNVYGVPNNPYKDLNGNPTNGATTGPHLHFSIKKDGKAVNPLNYY